LKEEGDPDSMR